MDFRLSDDQRAIAALASDLFAGDGDTPPDWQTLVEAGLPALLVPEALGGVGLGMVDLALLLIEQGRGLAVAPLWRHALAAAALADVDIGDARATVAPTARLTARDGVVSGRATAVAGAGGGWLVAPVDTGDGPKLFGIRLDAAGIDSVDGVLTDGTAAADLTLTDVAARPLGLRGDWLADRAAACLAALTVGVSRGAIERTARYVGARQQFGRAIGSFQAVAQRMADAFGDVEVTQTLLFELAWSIDAGVPSGSIAPVATWWANQCAHRVAHTAMHLHGGIGADTSYPIHRVLLMSRALELELGGAHRALARIGERLAA